MKKIFIPSIFIGVILCIFFQSFWFHGKIPVPTDALVGLYHPWRDVFANEFPRGVPFKNFLISDPVRQQIPWRKNAIEQWKQGRVPFWNAYEFSGAPLLGNPQSGALYPFNIFFWILDFENAWIALVILQPILSIVGMYLFLRMRGATMWIGLLSGLLWAFCGFQVAWFTWGTIGHVICWLGFTLFAIEKLLRSKNAEADNKYWYVLLVTSWLLTLLAGHLQISLYTIGLSALYVVARSLEQKRWGILMRIILFASIAGGIGVTLVYPQIIHVLSSSRMTEYSTTPVDGWFIPLSHLLMFFVPDYFGNPATLNYWGVWNYGEMIGYVGVVGIIFAVIGGLSGKWNTKFWFSIFFVAFICATDNPVSQFMFRLRLPIIGAMQPTRLLVLIDFSLIMLAMKGLSTVLQASIDIKKIYVAIGSIMIILCVLWLNLHTPLAFMPVPPESAISTQRNLFYSTTLFLVSFCIILLYIKRKGMQKAFIICLLLLSFIDLYRFFIKFTPFSDKVYFYPKSQIITYLQNQPDASRVLSLNDELFPPNAASYYGVSSLDGYDPFIDERYMEFIAALDRKEPNIAKPFGFNRIVRANSMDSPLVGISGVNYVVSLADINNSNFETIISEGKTKLYKRRTSVPQAYIATNIIVAGTSQKQIEALHDKNFILGQSVVVEGNLAVSQAPLAPEEQMSVVSEKQGDMITQAKVVVPRLIVFTKRFAPGWHVTVDGYTAELIRVNYIYSGLLLQPGDHTVRFIYHDGLF